MSQERKNEWPALLLYSFDNPVEMVLAQQLLKFPSNHFVFVVRHTRLSIRLCEAVPSL